MSQSIDVMTPIGRLVQGSITNGKSTNKKGETLYYKTGVNTGQVRTDYFMAIACPKNDVNGNPCQEWAKFYAEVAAKAFEDWPNLHDPNTRSLYTPHAFSMKITDGDDPTPRGDQMKRNCDKPGFPGNWIISMNKIGNPPKCYKLGSDNCMHPYDGDGVKKGHFVRVCVDVKSNNSTDTPGMYVTGNDVEFVAFGEEIFTGRDPNETFANRSTQPLPPGASDTPINTPEQGSQGGYDPNQQGGQGQQQGQQQGGYQPPNQQGQQQGQQQGGYQQAPPQGQGYAAPQGQPQGQAPQQGQQQAPPQQQQQGGYVPPQQGGQAPPQQQQQQQQGGYQQPPQQQQQGGQPNTNQNNQAQPNTGFVDRARDGQQNEAGYGQGAAIPEDDIPF